MIRLVLAAGLLVATSALAEEELQYIIRIDGVTCPFCIATSERALAKIAGVHSVHSDLDSGRVYVCADPTADLSPESLARLFRSKGFTYRSVRTSRGCHGTAPPRRGRPAPAAAERGQENGGGGF